MTEPVKTKCPKCGGESGYYHKYIQSHTQFITFDGKCLDNHAEYMRGGTRKHCMNCEKDITEFVKSLKLT